MRRAGPGADAGSMSLTPAPSSHAVVVGASMGGLAAAAAVSRHVDLVTIVERDELPTSPASRSGTPQGRHLHVLDHALGLRPARQPVEAVPDPPAPVQGDEPPVDVGPAQAPRPQAAYDGVLGAEGP